MTKFLHTADLHYNPRNPEPALKSLRCLLDTVEAETPDVVVIAGDLFDRGVQYNNDAGFPVLHELIQSILNRCAIIATYGTPTHDIPGCYDVFRRTQAKKSFTVFAPSATNWAIWRNSYEDKTDVLFLGLPEPQRGWFLGNTRMGRDEATTAIQAGMRSILLGMAAKRREFAELPCVMLYHGNVAGASMCNGQNMPPGDITIGADDLALVDADYYALGHIHQAQKIGDDMAFYPGSAYPVNWGELDQKQFNLVEIAGKGETASGSARSIEVTHLSYPHPPRRKIVIEVADGQVPADSQYEGVQVWQVVRGTKDELQDFNVPLEEIRLQSLGAHPGSRVTTEIIPTETVRAGDIEEARFLREKLSIYAENSGAVVTQGIFDKADELEREARDDGLAPDGLHIRIQSLSLRGAIGIWRGLGVDEITLDLDDYEDGLIAIVGPNGAGKSTLIENMQPYPDMVTRGGKLADHFRLKNSHRDLYFADYKTGFEYRALIVIDPTLATPKADYNLYVRDSDGFAPITNGRKEDYEKKIQELFGSPSLFMRSAFLAQRATKANPDLSDATKGEKKALFRELGGMDYLEAYSQLAKEKAKAIENGILEARGKADALRTMIDAAPDYKAKKEELDRLIATLELSIRSIEQDGLTAKERLEELAELNQEQRRATEEIERIDKEHERRVEQIEEETQKIRHAEAVLTAKPAAESELQRYDELKDREGALHADRAGIADERERLLGEWEGERKTVANCNRGIDQCGKTIEEEIHAKALEKTELIAEIDRLDGLLAVPLEEDCPTCKRKLEPETLQKLQEKRNLDTEALKEAQSLVFDIDQDIEEKDREAAALEQERQEEPPKPELPEYDDFELSDVQDKIAGLDAESLRSTIALGETAEARIHDIRNRLTVLVGENSRGEHRREKLTKRLRPEIAEEYNTLLVEQEQLRAYYVEIKQDLSRTSALIAEAVKQQETHKARVQELTDAESGIAGRAVGCVEWIFLQKACGPDGIQALELDAMGPGIAAVANSLLSAAYGSRFQIEFRTTRIGGKGSQTKQIEDFQIIVHDYDHASVQLLETLSGGEAVWVRKAIYDAFGILRARNTGVRFLTVFLDEADGALDPESRERYFRLLQAAHTESGRRHTLVITHSPDVQEMIPQRINMQELKEEPF